jgi:uncharacterized protein YecE (DUF72 family)
MAGHARFRKGVKSQNDPFPIARPVSDSATITSRGWIKFFSSIDRQHPNLCWERRGDWDPATLKSICKTLRLWHVVDPFVAKTTTPENCYFRLHGRAGWRYQYEAGELEELAASLPTRTRAIFF